MCNRTVDRLVKGACLSCYQKWLRPKIVCSGCGRTQIVHSNNLCQTCYHRQPSAKRECVSCKRVMRMNHKEGYCGACYQRLKQPHKECSSCGQVTTMSRGSLCHKCAHRENKRLAFEKLGGQCDCCHEFDFNLLTIDHVECDGAAHRKALRDEGKCAYKTIVREILNSDTPPERYRLLCWSCNSGREVAPDGVCHQPKRRDALRELNKREQQTALGGASNSLCQKSSYQAACQEPSESCL